MDTKREHRAHAEGSPRGESYSPSGRLVLANRSHTNGAKAESRASSLALPRRSGVMVRKHYYAGAERVAARMGSGGLDAIGHAIGSNDTLLEKADLLYKQSLDHVNNRVLLENDLDCIMNSKFAKDVFGHPIDGIPSRMQAGVELNHDQFKDMTNSMLSDFSQGDEPDVYFYHSDLCKSREQSQAGLGYAETQRSVRSKHLGSASWITDSRGVAVQHIQYLPYGEPYIKQRLSGYNERFTFTGKGPRKGWRTPLNTIICSERRDVETGYGYFGARYMDHELTTMWLSVDPMSDKYPSVSPYAYCAWNRPTGGQEHRLIKSNLVNNPVKLVDPDGRDWYQNTKTKQIYYNSGARGSNDAGKYGRMQGQEGWLWIGENNMFKETSGKDDRQLSLEYFNYSRTQQKGYSVDKSNVGQLVPNFETDILIPSSEYRKFKKENFGREFSFSIKFDLCIGTGGSYDLGIGRKRNGERFVFSTRSVSVGESVGVSVNLNVSSLDSHISSDGSSSNISASHGLITGSLGPGGYSIGVGVGCPGITYSEGKAKTKRIK